MDLDFDVNRYDAAQRRLRAQLANMPSSGRVAQTSGPLSVKVSEGFDAAVAYAAQALVKQLDWITSQVEAHADALRAAARELSGSDSQAALTLTSLVDAVDSAQTTPAAAPAPSTVAGVAAKTGSM